jgi:hypothetical protein
LTVFSQYLLFYYEQYFKVIYNHIASHSYIDHTHCTSFQSTFVYKNYIILEIYNSIQKLFRKPLVMPLAYAPGERARKGHANPPAQKPAVSGLRVRGIVHSHTGAFILSISRKERRYSL